MIFIHLQVFKTSKSEFEFIVSYPAKKYSSGSYTIYVELKSFWIFMYNFAAKAKLRFTVTGKQSLLKLIRKL